MEKDRAFARWLRALLAHSVGRAHDRDTIADLLPPFPLPAGASAKTEAAASNPE